MIWTVSQVAIGGAIGAALRFLMGLGIFRLTGPGFPMAILSVNVVGSFLMGLFVVYAAHRGATHLSPFVMTGLLGGFTTFSAFSLETMTLLERGETTQAAIYVIASVVFSVGALAAGLMVARGLFA
ncbi:MAG: fluoride efflux transporter CrcB [Pseudomonadota bacterium]